MGLQGFSLSREIWNHTDVEECGTDDADRIGEASHRWWSCRSLNEGLVHSWRSVSSFNADDAEPVHHGNRH